MACILMVDDESDGSEAVCRYLQRDGHDVICMPDAAEALAALPEVRPDLVILDLLMPRMDGIEFLQVLRNYRRGHHLPVIVLTALPEGPQTTRLSRLGVDRVFHKSDFRLDELLMTVNTILGAGAPWHDHPGLSGTAAGPGA